MWSTLSVGRWIFLLSLGAVMLLSVSEVETFPATISLPCCHKLSKRQISNITKCYEQKPRPGCWTPAFVITDHKNRTFCIKPSKWIEDRIKKGEVECPPDITLPH